MDILPHLRWWQSWKWLAALAGLVASCSFAAFTVTTIGNTTEVGDQGEVLDELSTLAESNAQAIHKIEDNQAGIDELVGFVRDLQAEPNDVDDDTVQTFIDLLCASSDPVRQAACAELEGAAP